MNGPSIQEQPLFGGAIAAAIPQGWVDGSNLRQVPDHQELFLSSTTLSSVIFEINEFVANEQAVTVSSATQGAALLSSFPSSALPSPAAAEDVVAALYHVHDLCDETEGDTIEMVSPPERVTLPRLSQRPVRAYAGSVRFKSFKKRRPAQPQPQPQGDQAGANGVAAQRSTYSCRFLVIRLPEQTTDICVYVNVPFDEFEERGDEAGLAAEEALATALLARIVEVFEVKDWGLFG